MELAVTATHFHTTRDLFDAFPTVKNSVKIVPGDEEPVAAVRKLADSGQLREASALCAYLLRRREAVWWACRSLRLRPGLADADDQALRAAEHWAQSPSEEARDVAAKWAAVGDQAAPQTWAAYAAGYSGGTLGEGFQRPVRVPVHLTAESARLAVLLCEARLGLPEAQSFLRECVDAALVLLAEPPKAGR